jgi:hypothetical protein
MVARLLAEIGYQTSPEAETRQCCVLWSRFVSLGGCRRASENLGGFRDCHLDCDFHYRGSAFCVVLLAAVMGLLGV